jgi:hypothetical protein
MNLAPEIAGAFCAIVFVWAMCRRDWPTAAGAIVGVLIFVVLALMSSDEDRRDRWGA